MLKLNLTLFAAASLLFVGCQTKNVEQSETKGFGTNNMTINGKAVDKYVWAIPRVSKSGQKYVCFYYNDNNENFSSAKQFSQYAVMQEDLIAQLKRTAQSVSQKTLNGGGGKVAFETSSVAGQGSAKFEMEPQDVPMNYGMMTEQFLNDLRKEGRTDKIAQVSYGPFAFAWYLLGRIQDDGSFNKGFQCAQAENAASKAENTVSSFDEQKEIMRSVHDAMDSARHPTSKKSILKWNGVSKGWAFEGSGWGY